MLARHGIHFLTRMPRGLRPKRTYTGRLEKETVVQVPPYRPTVVCGKLLLLLARGAMYGNGMPNFSVIIRANVSTVIAGNYLVMSPKNRSIASGCFESLTK
eukprot:1032429-Amphidinium_carterae.1